MTFRTTITDDTASPMLEAVAQTLESEVRPRLQMAGATRFAGIVRNNFGFAGEDRPAAWPELSPRYAKRHHGGVTVPTLILSGELEQSIQVESQPEYAEVFTENEYAIAHQEGNDRGLPARPFFPMDEAGSPTNYAESEVMAAIETELEGWLATL